MANDLPKISFPTGLYFRGILPATFDDTLSYYEQIAQLYSKMSELVEYVNNLERLAEDYTDEQIKNLKRLVADQISIIQQEFLDMANEFDDLKKTVDKILPDSKKYTDDEVAGAIATMQTYVDEAEKRLQAYINEQAASIQVVNFFTGELVTIQEMFDYLCALHLAVDGITYQALIAKGITYDAIAQKNKTYGEIVRDGNAIFN